MQLQKQSSAVQDICGGAALICYNNCGVSLGRCRRTTSLSRPRLAATSRPSAPTTQAQRQGRWPSSTITPPCSGPWKRSHSAPCLLGASLRGSATRCHPRTRRRRPSASMQCSARPPRPTTRTRYSYPQQPPSHRRPSSPTLRGVQPAHRRCPTSSLSRSRP